MLESTQLSDVFMGLSSLEQSVPQQNTPTGKNLLTISFSFPLFSYRASARYHRYRRSY